MLLPRVTNPHPQLDKIPVQHLKILTYFYHRPFLFHVSFFTFNKVIINDFKRWNIKIICFTFSFIVSLFHFYRFAKKLEITTMKKNTMRAIYRSHCVFKSLPQCSWIAPTVFSNRSHSVFESLPQCFLEEWNMKAKMKHTLSMFHLLNILIINALNYKNETWNIK